MQNQLKTFLSVCMCYSLKRLKLNYFRLICVKTKRLQLRLLELINITYVLCFYHNYKTKLKRIKLLIVNHDTISNIKIISPRQDIKKYLWCTTT